MTEFTEEHEEVVERITGPFWWVKHILLVLVSGLFLVFGIHVMVLAYDLKNPHNFIMTFFSASFIILISGALMFGFGYRMWYFYRKGKNN